MTQQIANYISYALLAVSFVILVVSIRILKRSRKMLEVELEVAARRSIDKKKTQPVAIGYENWYKDIGT
jgi:hypothetical protein